MSGEPKTTTKAFALPSPIDGMNLISPPRDLKDTEALLIENYYCFDWGITQRAQISVAHTFSTEVGQLIPFSEPSNSTLLGQSLLVCADHKFYKSQDLTTYTEVTHTGAVTTNSWAWAQFNKNIYLMDSANHTYRYDVVANTLTVDPYTGPSANLIQGTAYKSRFYGIEANTSKVWYSDVASISGALHSFDVSQILNTSDNLLFVTNWNYNQGLSNDELLVFVTTNGEVLVYQGDYPADTTWSLVAHIFIPKPINQFLFKVLGQDVLIQTQRGVVSLKEIISGRGAEDQQYYLVSRNLGNALLGYSGGLGVARDVQWPFLYFIPNDARYLYVLNFERGSWSRWNNDTTGTNPEGITEFDSIACIGPYLLMSDMKVTLYKMPTGPTTGSNTTAQLYNFQTKYFEFGNTLQKSLKQLRAIVQRAAPHPGAGDFHASVQASVDFDGSTLGSVSSINLGNSVSGTVKTLDLSPSAQGRSISFSFSEALNTQSLTVNSLVGLEAIVDVGGIY